MKDVGAPEGSSNNSNGRAGKTNGEKISPLVNEESTPKKTAAKVAAETGVTDRTVRNDAKYAKAVDTVAAIHKNPTEAKSAPSPV